MRPLFSSFPQRPSPQQPSALRLLHDTAWQQSRHMRSLFDECTQQALFLAMFARNACFSRSKWQDPRPMRPFPGSIGWFWIHGVKILPERSPFRVGRSEIIHCAKMLPGLLGLQCGHKKGSPNGDPSNKFFGSTQRLPDAYSLCTKRTSLRFPIWGGLRKWAYRRCGLSVRFPI